LRAIRRLRRVATPLAWLGPATALVVVVVLWRSPHVRYSLKAASLALGALLTTPYLFMYDMMVLAIPVAFIVRLGLASGFRPYELPSLVGAFALCLTFSFTGIPTGLVVNLIVATLVLRRAGPWWRTEMAPAVAPAAA